jgi:putative redox protein
MAKNVTSEVILSEKKYLGEAKMRNHFAVLDEPIKAGGGDTGPTPVEYLLTAIGGCVVMTLRMYAERKDWNLGKIKVIVSQKEELTSSGIRKSLLEEITVENEITEDQRIKLLEIAGKCPVAKMVKGKTEIATSIQ